MSTRRHAKSEKRRSEQISRLVALCMAEIKEHATEAKFFLITSSVHPQLAQQRDSTDSSFQEFQQAQTLIYAHLQNHQWAELRDLVKRLDQKTNFCLAESIEEIEGALYQFRGNFSGFGVPIGSDVVWMPDAQTV